MENEEWSKGAVSEGQSETFLYLSKVFNLKTSSLMLLQSHKLAFKYNLSKV